MSTMSTGSDRVDGVNEFDWFVGIDWGTAQHAIQLVDATGRQVAEQTVDHTSLGLARFAAWLEEQTGGRWERVAVGIEVPRGAVVELLLERGAAVFTLNPKQLDRFRDRFSVAGAKDDQLDARVVASALRTDRERFRRVAMDDPLVIRVRELTRAGDVLREEKGALANRLRELVHRIAPQWLTLSPTADERWFWAFVEQAATPTLGRSLRRAKLERLLEAHRIRRITVDQVLDVLTWPPLRLAPGTVEAVTRHIQLLLPRLRLVEEQRALCERDLEAVLDELEIVEGPSSPPPSGPSGEAGHRDGRDGARSSDRDAEPSSEPSDVAILRSVAGIGVHITAAFIADARPLLALRDYEALRAVSGVAPVRRQTGKQKRGKVSMRYACNVRLRNACYHWARVSTQVDAAARHYYATLRARGHSHARALRSVADRWLRILTAMLKTRTLYDPTRFATRLSGGLQPATQT